MIIVTVNPEINTSERSFLNKSYASGVGTINVRNIDRFKDDQIILIGEMARERSEIRAINGTPSGSSIVLATVTSNPHDADDPVYVLDFDKVKIYRSTTGINGTYALLEAVDIDVDNEDGKTYYSDPNALTTYYYQTAYYNSVDDTESERSGKIAATGYTPEYVGAIITEVSKELKDADFIEMSIDEYISSMNDINNDLITQAKRPFKFLKTSQPLTAAALSSTIAFPTNLWKINYIEVNETATATSRVYRPKKVSPTEARYRLSAFPGTGDYVDGIAIDDEDDKLIFFPKARVERINAFTIHFYKHFTTFTSLDNKIETPNSLIYKLGLKRDFYLAKADSDSKWLTKATIYDKRYNAEAMKLQREKSIEASGPSGMSPDKKKYPQFGGRRYRQ